MKKYDILLGYDDPRMLKAIGWALEEKGYHVTKVTSAKAVLDALAKKDFDLVLIDLDLHKTDDIDVLQKAKQVNPETMVIILCCKDDVTYSHDALRVDADDYIFRPCSKAKLWKRVANCLERMELKRNNDLPESQGAAFDERILNMLRTTINEIKNPLGLTEDILELINWGVYGKSDDRVGYKLIELYKIVTKLNETVEGVLQETSEITKELGIEQKTPDWKKDIVNPLLGNIPG